MTARTKSPKHCYRTLKQRLSMLATVLAVCASIQDDSIHVSGSGASLEFPVSASVDGNGIEGQFLGVSGHANSGGVGYNVELPVFGSVMGAAASPDGVEGHLKGASLGYTSGEGVKFQQDVLGVGEVGGWSVGGSGASANVMGSSASVAPDGAPNVEVASPDIHKKADGSASILLRHEATARDSPLSSQGGAAAPAGLLAAGLLAVGLLGTYAVAGLISRHSAGAEADGSSMV